MQVPSGLVRVYIILGGPLSINLILKRRLFHDTQKQLPGASVKVFLKISQWWNLFFNKVADLRPATSLKKKHQHRSFSVNFAKSLRTTFFKDHFRWVAASRYMHQTSNNITISACCYFSSFIQLNLIKMYCQHKFLLKIT